MSPSRTFYARASAAALVAAGVAAAVLSLGTADASVRANAHSPKGDNGTVKVHRSTTSPDNPRNEPKVCGFYLVGFHFDGGQQVSWRIVSWPPTGNRTEVLHGTLALGQDGHGRTNDLKLPDGHYKLYWTFNGENGRAKQKVFWVKCGSTDQPTPPPTGTAPTPQATASASPSTPASAAPVPTPVPTDLPVTG